MFKFWNIRCIRIGTINWECGSCDEISFLRSKECCQTSNFSNFPNAPEWDGCTAPVQILQVINMRIIACILLLNCLIKFIFATNMYLLHSFWISTRSIGFVKHGCFHCGRTKNWKIKHSRVSISQIGHTIHIQEC